MVLTTRNTGKYLTREWNDPDRERQMCIHNMEMFSSNERAFYEVNGTGIYDGLGYQVESAYTVYTSPVDSKTPATLFDRRELPEV